MATKKYFQNLIKSGCCKAGVNEARRILAIPEPTAADLARLPVLLWFVVRREGLAKADLRRADLRGADLRGAKLVGADLRGATFEGPDGRGYEI